MIDNKTGFFSNLGEHSKECYFTVKGFQIVKFSNSRIWKIRLFYKRHVNVARMKIPKMIK